MVFFKEIFMTLKFKSNDFSFLILTINWFKKFTLRLGKNSELGKLKKSYKECKKLVKDAKIVY